MADTPLPPIAYGVWIDGRGWLAHPDHPHDPFASLNIEVAETAAALWGDGAEVWPFDNSLRDLQGVFLKQQAAEPVPQKAWWQRWRI